MVRKGRKKKKNFNFNHGLEEETVHTILALVLFVFGAFFVLASLEKAGLVGSTIYRLLSNFLGIGYYLLPTLSFVVGISYLRSVVAHFAVTKTIGSLLFFLSGIAIIELSATGSGGFLGYIIAKPLVGLFDSYAAFAILITTTLISLLMLFNTRPTLAMLLFWRRWQKDTDNEEYEEEEYYEDEPEEEYEEEEEKKPSKIRSILSPNKKVSGTDGESMPAPTIHKYTGAAYAPPPLSLLAKDNGKPGAGDVKANANIIKRTLRNFGIDVEMDEISVGPSVTRYAIKPAEGIRLTRILGLQKNLELALAAHPVRIEAPIPGKALVGIEIPNRTKSMVGLASLLSASEFKESTKALLVSLGRGISGSSLFTDIAKMPHLLIAGATGSGKSVTIHTLIMSLLFRNSPENLKFVMVDPKRVELTLYKGIPHLLTPVITDSKKTILALKWLVNEMERRYDILESHQVRDLQSYHTNVLMPSLKKKTDGEEAPETMPYIVVVIDELADIMSTYPRELEAGIVRLAQMSRAIGIHLMLSTQRPSVNVITGLIKANVPARVALQVNSQVDSRTILDMSGAEKLLGAGDMLYLSGEMAKPVRIQSAFISEEEIKKVVTYLKKNYDENFDSDMELAVTSTGSVSSHPNGGGFDDEEEDELYEKARETVIEAGKASTSYLQRKLRVGYARAARLMDILEERGAIGPQDGSKAREVLEGQDDEAYGETEDEEEWEDEAIDEDENNE
jgi:S-DNA-T family DNA segregation ATPase FtsK/SpoIIIE